RLCGLDLDKVVIVSGIGCSGRVAGYIKLDSFPTTHGRAIPFATGLHLANRRLKVVVVSGDGDLIAIGGNHFIHAARRNVDLTVLCINNFNYAMTGGQLGPGTPIKAVSTTTPYGNFENPFNLPALAASSGAVYVARWTSLHVRRLTKSLVEAIRKKGFSFVEVIAPCPTLYTRRNKLGTSLEVLDYYREKSEIRHGADPNGAGIEFGGKILVGKFVDVDKPSFLDNLDESMRRALGDAYGLGKESYMRPAGQRALVDREARHE
ncbi:MAG: 2-oxoacid:ferredoxin oxidoreductase subunit beta, partial [Candidatus Latescibacterota bacterium]